MKTNLLTLILLILTLSSSAQTQIATGASSPSGLVVVGDYIYTVNLTNNSLVRADKTQVGTNNFETVVTSINRSGTTGNLFGIYDSVYTPGIANGTMTYTDVSAGTAFPVYYSPYILNIIPAVSNIFYYNGLHYIANSANGSAELIEHYNLSGGNLIATLPVDYQYISDVTTDGSVMYFSTTTGSIFQIDLAATTPVTTVVASGLGEIKGIHFADDHLYYLNASQVRKVHKSTLAVTVVSSVAGGAVAMEIDGYDIYAANAYGRIYKINDPDFAPCTVSIPDANFKSYLVGNTTINTNGDTEIQCSEATAFAGSIFCDNLSISDLTGIEAFPNIIELFCHDNNLTTINVSSNTALIYLDVSGNSLSSIDASAIVGLRQFDVSDNPMSSIDVSFNTALISLYCYNDNLTSLDLSNNTALIELSCGNNALTALDVTANSTLYDIYCQNNALTSLKVANGVNSPYGHLNALNNPNLTCIEVDDVAWSTANWIYIDATASFSTDCSALSVGDFTFNVEVSLYPNPTTSVLNIKMTNHLKQATIYSVLGRKVLETTSKTIQTSNLKAGLYLIKIEDENGNVSTQKFIKK